MPRILIVKLSAIGDCLLASPVLEALRRGIPESHLAWAVHPHCAPVLRCNPFLNQLVEIPRRPFLRSALAKREELQGFDIVIDLQGLLKSGIICKLTGARRVIGPTEAREGARHFYTERVARQNAHLHVIPGYLRLAAAAGGMIDPEPPMHMPYSDADLQYAKKLVAGLSRPLVVFNPSAGKPNKLWSGYGQLAASLPGATLLMTGAPADRELVDRFVREAPHLVNLCGQTNLNQLAALLSQVDLFVGGDTGPMHMAQAVGTRVIALFGPTNPAILGPRDARHRILRSPTGEMNDLSVEIVHPMVKEVLCEVGHSR